MGSFTVKGRAAGFEASSNETAFIKNISAMQVGLARMLGLKKSFSSVLAICLY